MAEIREEDGRFYRRQAGRQEWEEVTPEEAEVAGQGRLERMGSSLARGAEGLVRGGAAALDQLLGDQRGAMAPESAEANRARLAELERIGQAMGDIDPRAGLTAYAPEALGALVPGGLPVAIGTEAAIGAARTPERPLLGAAIGGGATLAGGALLGPLARGAGRLTGRGGAGAAKGVEMGEAAIEGARREGVRATLRERLFGGGTRETGSPGSITGLDTAEIGQAVRQGWGTRMAGFADRAPDDAFNREAAELGFRLTPGVAQGSKALRQVETMIESRPGGAAAFADLRQQNEQALNRLMVEALGGEGAELTPQALNAMREGLEGTFEEVGRRIGRVDLKSALREVNGLVEGIEDPTVHRWISPIADRLPMELNGPDLMKRLSKYRRDADNLWAAPGGDRAKAEALDRLADVVENHMLRQAPRQVGEALKDATERWRLLRTVDRGNVINQEGTISPGNLNQALQQRYRNEYRYDRGTGNEQVDRLLKGARVAWRMRDIVGNSGTATRSQSLLEALTTGQLTRGFGQAYLDGLDLEAAARMAAGAGASGLGGAAVLGGAGSLLD